jgi:hypothetical protein
VLIDYGASYLMSKHKKPKWIPPTENTGSESASRKKDPTFWARGGVFFTSDPRRMKTPHETRRKKYEL